VLLHWKVIRNADHQLPTDAVVYGPSGGEFLAVDRLYVQDGFASSSYFIRTS
jgi:hypothetical protein